MCYIHKLASNTQVHGHIQAALLTRRWAGAHYFILPGAKLSRWLLCGHASPGNLWMTGIYEKHVKKGGKRSISRRRGGQQKAV